MSEASRPTRRSKRGLAVAADDVEPTSSKRAVKSAEGNEEEAGPTIAELQEENLALKEALERVSRVALEKELRAERAEKQLESKQAMIDGSERVMELEKTVSSLKKQLEEERKEWSEERERDGKKIDELTFQLSKYALGIDKPPQPQIVVDKVPEDQPLTLQQLLDGAAPSLVVQQLVVDKQPQPPLTLQQLLQQNSDEAARAPAVERLYDSGHPTNILQMCRPDMPYSISLADAVIKLGGPYRRCGPGNFFKNCYVANGKVDPLQFRAPQAKKLDHKRDVDFGKWNL